jgi:hypothetical protein
MDVMSLGAEKVILEDFVQVRVFSGTDAAEAFLESGKATVGALWSEYQNRTAR